MVPNATSPGIRLDAGDEIARAPAHQDRAVVTDATEGSCNRPGNLQGAVGARCGEDAGNVLFAPEAKS